VSSAWSNVAAVPAAALFAVATTLQHRAARSAAPISGASRDAGRAIAGLVVRPLWLGGLVADLGGFGLHPYALSTGELAVVQPLLVTGLVFALVLGARLEGRRVTRAQLGWSVTVVGSLALFLVLARPAGAGTRPELGPAAAAAAGSLALVAGSLVLASRSGPTRRSATLGLVTGLLFGLTAALIKAVGGQVGSGLVAVISGWPIYALLVIGPAGFVVNQLAFQAGPLAASLPAITAVDPLVSIVLGLLLFDEQLHGRPAAAVAECAALSVLALSVLRLARTEQLPRGEEADSDRVPA